MNYKSDVNTTVTRNVPDFDKKTGNVYESIVIISKRANQISSEMKDELNAKLSEFNSSTDNLEDCLLYTSPSPRDRTRSRMPSSA